MSAKEASATGEPKIGCILDPVLNFLALRWLAHILWFLGLHGTLRFAELQHVLPGHASAKVLSGRLKQLEALKMIERLDRRTKPLNVAYLLTDHGPAIHEMLGGLESRARPLSLPTILPLGSHRRAKPKAQ